MPWQGRGLRRNQKDQQSVSNLLLSGLLPRRWHWEPMNGFYSEIVLDWLDFKIDQQVEERLPVLRKIYGHQRREVIDWLDMMKDRRDTEITRSIYGDPGACV
jgi:hypothetical protein